MKVQEDQVIMKVVQEVKEIQIIMKVDKDSLTVKKLLLLLD
jgi:hypothetical protein